MRGADIAERGAAGREEAEEAEAEEEEGEEEAVRRAEAEVKLGRKGAARADSLDALETRVPDTLSVPAEPLLPVAAPLFPLMALAAPLTPASRCPSTAPSWPASVRGGVVGATEEASTPVRSSSTMAASAKLPVVPPCPALT